MSIFQRGDHLYPYLILLLILAVLAAGPIAAVSETRVLNPDYYLNRLSDEKTPELILAAGIPGYATHHAASAIVVCAAPPPLGLELSPAAPGPAVRTAGPVPSKRIRLFYFFYRAGRIASSGLDPDRAVKA